MTEVLERITAPIFVFESIVEKRYDDAGYDTKADARTHRIILEYLEGRTDKDASECVKRVLDLAQTERPIVCPNSNRMKHSRREQSSPVGRRAR